MRIFGNDFSNATIKILKFSPVVGTPPTFALLYTNNGINGIKFLPKRWK